MTDYCCCCFCCFARKHRGGCRSQTCVSGQRWMRAAHARGDFSASGEVSTLVLGPAQGDAGRLQVTNWLCQEETDACKKAAPPLPRGRKPGPAFKPMDKQELDMQRMMASMQARALGG